MLTTATPPESSVILGKRLRDAVGHAILAPSSHNSQPWLFRIKDSEIELFADPRRACSVVDPFNRELFISCGAALYQLKLAMQCDGLATLVKVMPPSCDDNLVARVMVAGTHIPSADERALWAAIPKRRTNRFPFAERIIDPSLRNDWTNDVQSEHAWVEFVDDQSKKHEVADLIAQGDRLQASDTRFRHELAKWVHSNANWRRDGIPGYSQGVGDVASYFGSLLVRSFNWGDGQAAKDRQLAEGSPLLAVIGTVGDTRADWIACGQALAKLSLRAAGCSVDASYLNQPIEVPELRTRLTERMGATGYPQILLRLGHGCEVKPTPRRAIEDVLID